MRTPDPLRGNGQVVDSLGHALRSGEHGLSTVPGLLKRVLGEESWREFITQRGEHIQHERFADFITTPPLRGLGATVELVDKVVKGTEVEDDWDKALGRKPRSDKIEITSNVDNIHASGDLDRPSGTSRRAALRKLRKDAPDLHADVLAGRLTAHAAMVRAGFRSPIFTVRPEPESAARALRKHMTPEQIAELARLLAGDA